eukprot:2296546-Pleurochrysis_carterae.AAC.1
MKYLKGCSETIRRDGIQKPKQSRWIQSSDWSMQELKAQSSALSFGSRRALKWRVISDDSYQNVATVADNLLAVLVSRSKKRITGSLSIHPKCLPWSQRSRLANLFQSSPAQRCSSPLINLRGFTPRAERTLAPSALWRRAHFRAKANTREREAAHTSATSGGHAPPHAQSPTRARRRTSHEHDGTELTQLGSIHVALAPANDAAETSPPRS